MDIELIEIREFLLGRPPFSQLGPDALNRLVRHITIRYLRRGSPFPPRDSSAPALYIVRQGAVELRDSQAQLLEILAEGELYSEQCATIDAVLHHSAQTREDTLLYQIPCAVIDKLCAEHEAIAHHLSHSLSERLHHALQAMQQAQGSGLLTVRCGDLIRRSPVSATADITIREAAQRMSRENISALLIERDGKLEGIVTDRDLRNRCLASELSSATAVSAIMTTPLHRLTAESSAYEALLTMSRFALHHLPIVDQGQTIGMITATDLFRHQSANALHLVSAVRRCNSVDEVVEQAQQLPELQQQLLAAGATAHQLGKAITTFIDTITVRLLELTERELGPAPVPYTWLVFGSQARQEQSCHTDQDNGLLLDDRYRPEHAPYFAALAEQVCTALERCGIALCAGNVMASNPQWRQPLAQWQHYFSEWVNSPAPMALMHLSIFFDQRALHGATALAERLRAHMLGLTRNNTLFLAYLTANALHHRPPLGFFRQLVLEKDGAHGDRLDIKGRGLIPVVDLARIHALAAGLPEVNSSERLHAAVDEGVLSSEASDNLLDVLELLGSLRARHQSGQLREGVAPDNYLVPDHLSTLERRHLKDAFALIAMLQQTLAQRYQSERFA